ncbi:hypothetical protein [Ekhidna sp.]|uniref:hypothetical protein n=1 Tax=Ekhidna sp. TaxID=2608089 RepID=UPI003CCBCF25
MAFLKVALLVTCLYFIITKFRDQSISLNEIQWPNSIGMIVGFVSILMILNWYLEALRWKVSLQFFEAISIKKAWQVILGGLALNWVLPFTSGDLLARISQQNDKYQTTSAAFLNRGIMLFLTFLIGSYGTSKLAVQYDVFSEIGILIFIFVPIIKWIFKKQLNRFFLYFKTLKRSTLICIISISLVRYLVFVFQFYLLLNVFLPELSTELLVAGIGWIFLIRSVLPLVFGGIGVREASGILFFEPHVSNLQMVIVPIFLIWVINTIIPSLVGLIFIWRFKANIAR